MGQFLCARITKTAQTIHHLKHNAFFQKRQLELTLQHNHFHALESLKDKMQEREKETSRKSQKKFAKLQTFCRTTGQSRHIPERWVVNLSSRPLNDGETSVLAKGLNFAPVPSKVPIPQMVAAVEDGCIGSRNTEAVDRTRSTIVGILQKARPPVRNLQPIDIRSLKNLRENESLVIVPADKGRSTVVMDRSEYDQKIRTLLADTKTYKKLNRDPAASLERRMNDILLSLNRTGSIPDLLYRQLRSSSGMTSLFYGLPKIHKPQVPLRPIASFINSPSYQLSKH